MNILFYIHWHYFIYTCTITFLDCGLLYNTSCYKLQFAFFVDCARIEFQSEVESESNDIGGNERVL